MGRCDEHPNGCPAAAPGRAFFVSVISGSRHGFLAGPYATHPEALDHVRVARERAEAADSRAVFYRFGTCQGPAELPTVFGLL